MDSYLHTFKGDLIQSVWEHGKRMFKPAILVGIITFVITGALTFLLFTYLFGWDLEFFTKMRSGNPLENQLIIQEKMQDYVSNPSGMVGSFFLFSLVLIFIQTFVYTLMLKVSGNVASGAGDSLSSGFSKVTVKHILLLVLYFIVIGLTYIVLAAITFVLVDLISSLVLLLLVPLYILLIVRLINVIPAIVLGDKSFGDAMRFSWKTITFKRAAYIVLGGIVIAILSFIILMLASLVFGLLGVVGVGLSIIFQMLLNVLILALSIAFFTAIYYRYAITEREDTLIESIGTE